MKKMLITVVILLTTLFAGCGGGGSTPVPVNVFHTTFTVGAETKDLSTTRGFLKFGTNNYDISYNLVSDVITKNYLYIRLPGAVSSGKVYSEQEVFLQYYDAAGTEYRSDTFGSVVTLTVTAWPGMGGYATGTYSATLKSDAIVPTDAVITNGKFDGFIIN